MTPLHIQPLTQAAFAPFGNVIELREAPDKIINQGNCGRHHDLANLSMIDGAAGISLFDAKPYALPLKLAMVERHPLGTQAFLPMTEHPFLVIVAPDVGGIPGTPLVFRTVSGQGVNYHKNTWHGVLTPLHAPGLFAVVDRIGDGANLQEHWFEEPYCIHED